MIDRATIERIFSAADIVDVVKDFVTLKRAGVNYKGLCPFHNDRTPSFVVSPAKQVCKCFSCGKGGNVVHFLMELEQMSYVDAIKWLGNKYGIEIHEKELTEAEKATQSLRDSLFVVNEWANTYFKDQLLYSVEGVSKGLAYLRSRNFSDSIIEKFQLGYSPIARDALSGKALAADFQEDYLIKTGLSFKTEDGQLFDRFHGRVIFPVFTVSGKVVAFGGRILSSEKKLAKYVNSPESEIYSKSNELYGLYQAKNAIIQKGFCFLVEGYTDVISMHQHGVENVVASSGTSLTQGQIRLLHRFTDKITILYDGDAAGIKASLRGIDMLLKQGLNIKVLLLPDGEDPDSFTKKTRVDEFQNYIESHQVDFIKFKTNLLLKECANDPIKRADLIENIVDSISVIPNPVVRQLYVSECAQTLSVGEELIINEINKKQYHKKKAKANEAEQNNSDKFSNVESIDSKVNTDFADSIVTNAIKSSEEETMLASLVIRYGGMLMDKNARLKSNVENHIDHIDSEQPKELITVAQYVSNELNKDALWFQSALYAQILDLALQKSEELREWESLPFFLQYIDEKVSKVAAQLGQDSFVLSTSQRMQYISDAQKLNDIVPRVVNDYKHYFVKLRKKTILTELKKANSERDNDRIEELMKAYMVVADLERNFAKILGERVVL